MTRLAAAVAALLLAAGCTPSDVIWFAFRHHPEHVRAQAVEVADCESRFVEDARSRGGHVGWFQLSRVHEARANRLGFTWHRVATDGLANAIVAENLYAETNDWRHWSCKP